jgi:hypothetical protein
VTLSLYSDNGGPGPGSLLVTSATTLFDTSLGVTPAPFTFPFSNYPLAANTRYWIVVSSPGGGSLAEWWLTETITGTETATEYWAFDGTVDPNAGDEAYLMQVNGDPATTPPAPPQTPAPASVTLVLIGLCGAAWYFGRRKALRSS